MSFAFAPTRARVGWGIGVRWCSQGCTGKWEKPALWKAAWGGGVGAGGLLTTSILCPASLFLWQGPCRQRGSPRTLNPRDWVLPPLAGAAGPRAGTSAKAQLRSKISVGKPGLALVVGESFILICSALSVLCRCSALMRESWGFFLLPLPQ